MRLRILVASALVIGVALISADADAKAVTAVTISGPGLRVPIRLANSNAADPASPVNALAAATGFDGAFFSSPRTYLSPNAPPGRLGPRYVATFALDDPGGPRVSVRQYLYPFANPAPLAYTPGAQKFFRVKSHGGWHPAGIQLTDLLVAAGAPEPPVLSVTAQRAFCLDSFGATPRSASRYLGLTLAAAQATAYRSGQTIRVIGADGSCHPLTSDFNQNRVDVYLVHDTVTAATTG